MKNIGRAELQVLIEKGAQIVEVLPRAEYDEDHLPGAINLPLRKIETDERKTLDPTRPVVVYCWDAA
jgi:rhodanese-related sulfurtransferase